MVKKLLERFTKTFITNRKTFKREMVNQKEFRIEKAVTKKTDKLYVKWKNCDGYLLIGLIRKIL